MALGIDTRGGTTLWIGMGRRHGFGDMHGTVARLWGHARDGDKALRTDTERWHGTRDMHGTVARR